MCITTAVPADNYTERSGSFRATGITGKCAADRHPRRCISPIAGEKDIIMGIFDNYEDVRENRPKNQHHIKGIVCDVKNCVHHDGDNYCTADRIAVGPSFATSCADTVCASFKPKAL